MFKAIATAALASAFIAGAPGAQAYTNVQRGNLAGFQGVTAIDRGDVDTITIPFTSHEAVVEVRCSTGEYTWNGIPQFVALKIKRAWCN